VITQNIIAHIRDKN